MHSPPDPDPARDGSPFTSPSPQPSSDDQPMSPTTADQPAIDVDPLVAQAAQKIAAVINDFKRELDQRDSVWGTASGSFELALNTDGSQAYELTIVHDEDGAEYPVTIRAAPKKGKEAANGHRAPLAPLMTAAASSLPRRPTRRASDSELEKDIVSRKKRRLDDGDSETTFRKRPRIDDDADTDNVDIMPIISKDDLEDLLAKLREDIQDDTSTCVNHVQRLLRRFKEEWHERCNWEEEQKSARAARGPFRDSIAGANGVAFPSPGVDRDDQNTSTNDLIRREAKLLSSQIRWVEECRRVAANIHEKREENWRTTSAGFHDRNRQDRENFQHRMLHESSMHAKVLNQVLNEVKAIGLYAQSMKWETPDHLSTHPAYPPQHMTPAFAQPLPGPTGRGRGRGGPQKR